jgi:hypothetical protein
LSGNNIEKAVLVYRAAFLHYSDGYSMSNAMLGPSDLPKKVIREQIVAELIFGGNAYILGASEKGKPSLVPVHRLVDMAQC